MKYMKMNSFSEKIMDYILDTLNWDVMEHPVYIWIYLNFFNDLGRWFRFRMYVKPEAIEYLRLTAYLRLTERVSKMNGWRQNSGEYKYLRGQ